jgi:ADP-ribose pyrophosphatase YjhB (NUDIX family)
MSPPRKACPVVIRRTTGDVEILAFRHPTAGCQLAKGTIEPAESIERAAERELFEESGLVGHAVEYLGAVQVIGPDQEWHFVLCEVEGRIDPEGEHRIGPLPETWTHHKRRWRPRFRVFLAPSPSGAGRELASDFPAGPCLPSRTHQVLTSGLSRPTIPPP